MYFEHLANELVLHIFQSCSSTSDVLNLASTCRHFHRVFSSQKLPILYAAAETQYGPLSDVTQIITHNASQPAHHHRRAPLSLALLMQLQQIGCAAQKWEDVYPTVKWKHNFEDRRLLTGPERYRLRRAIYRLWLYGRAFHNARYPRTTRTLRAVVLERADLLHNWSTPELAEMEDVCALLRHVLHTHICPSNGTIARKFRKRLPDVDAQMLCNIHLNYAPPPTLFNSHYHSTHQPGGPGQRFFPSPPEAKYVASLFHEPGSEGWGDDIAHYYVVEDMMKLDPGQIMWLRENAPLKGMVESYVKGLGEWFENNGETFVQTLEWVCQERGEDVQELRERIDGGGGIV
jgi:hypothetical protein